MTTVERPQLAIVQDLLTKALGAVQSEREKLEEAEEQIRRRLTEERQACIVQVAYSIEQLSKVTGDHPDIFRRRIHNTTLPARNTGHRYLVTKPAVVAAGLRNVDTLVDYREVIDQDVEYTLKELAAFLGLSVHAARRLVRGGRIKTVDRPSVLVKIRGAEILAYLAGCDDPMQHPESA